MAEIDEAACSQLYNTTSQAFQKLKTGKIAVKAINHLGDEVLKVFEVKRGAWQGAGTVSGPLGLAKRPASRSAGEVAGCEGTLSRFKFTTDCAQRSPTTGEAKRFGAT